MIDAILKNVATSDLLNCRQINRAWNEVSSRIMHQRGDIELTFSFKDGKFMKCIQHHPQRESLLAKQCPPNIIIGSKGLSDLLLCFQESAYFPFSSFRFDDLAMFGNEDMKNFLSIYGGNILALAIKLDDPENHVHMLRALLLEKVPNLMKLEIKFGGEYNYQHNIMSSVQLFAGSNQFEFPNLKVLCVNRNYEYFRGIVTDILKAASNLHVFGKCSMDRGSKLEEHITASDLTMLQSFNKLHCLKNGDILVSEELIAHWETSPMTLDLQLQHFSLSSNLDINQLLTPRVTGIINKLLDSSKNTVRKLYCPPLGLLSGLKIPKFEKLQKLYLLHDDSDDYSYTMFPPLFDFAEHFSNLQELSKANKMAWHCFTETDFFFHFSRVLFG